MPWTSQGLNAPLRGAPARLSTCSTARACEHGVKVRRFQKIGRRLCLRIRALKRSARRTGNRRCVGRVMQSATASCTKGLAFTAPCWRLRRPSQARARQPWLFPSLGPFQGFGFQGLLPLIGGGAPAPTGGGGGGGTLFVAALPVMQDAYSVRRTHVPAAACEPRRGKYEHFEWRHSSSAVVVQLTSAQRSAPDFSQQMNCLSTKPGSSAESGARSQLAGRRTRPSDAHMRGSASEANG